MMQRGGDEHELCTLLLPIESIGNEIKDYTEKREKPYFDRSPIFILKEEEK